ncbi:MAG: hypothetical protein WC438_04530 [Candidatus Pacearchaeota archaeon]
MTKAIKKPIKDNITTIKIEKETKIRLDNLKEHERETYNELIKKILHILNQIRKKPEVAKSILRNIDWNIARKHEYTSDIPKEQTEKPVQIPVKPKEIQLKKIKPISNPRQNPQQVKGSH